MAGETSTGPCHSNRATGSGGVTGSHTRAPPGTRSPPHNKPTTARNAGGDASSTPTTACSVSAVGAGGKRKLSAPTSSPPAATHQLLPARRTDMDRTPGSDDMEAEERELAEDEARDRWEAMYGPFDDSAEWVEVAQTAWERNR